jgi:hypothetical protein
MAFRTSESASIPHQSGKGLLANSIGLPAELYSCHGFPDKKTRRTIKIKTPSVESDHGSEVGILFHSLEKETMIEANRAKYLRVALIAVGLIFIVGIYSLIIVWSSGWSWHSGTSHSLPHYLQMILGVYATLGVFLLIASRNPLANLSLIWFTVWSSVVHAGIMAAQALANPEQMGHLWGDIPALVVVAAVLAFLTPRTAATEPAQRRLGKTATATAAR